MIHEFGFTLNTECIVSLWQRRIYKWLKLHLPFCEQPRMPFPYDFPTYPSKKQFMEYLESYASRFQLSPSFNVQTTFSFPSMRERLLWQPIFGEKITLVAAHHRERFRVVISKIEADFYPTVAASKDKHLFPFLESTFFQWYEELLELYSLRLQLSTNDKYTRLQAYPALSK